MLFRIYYVVFCRTTRGMTEFGVDFGDTIEIFNEIIVILVFLNITNLHKRLAKR